MRLIQIERCAVFSIYSMQHNVLFRHDITSVEDSGCVEHVRYTRRLGNCLPPLTSGDLIQ